VKGEAAGDVDDPVAQPLGLAAGELAGEQKPLRPGEEVVCDLDDLEPDGLCSNSLKSRLRMPVALSFRM
jgi:hypothetical protein